MSAKARVAPVLASIASASLLALLAGCRTTAPIELPPDDASPTASRDLGTLQIGCEDLEFAVSLNDDDDDGDGRADRFGPPSETEDNLRHFRFEHPEAAAVRISAPRILPVEDQAPGDPALGVRVRAYEADHRTPFDFSKPRELPLSLYLEGIESRAGEEVAFTIHYLDHAGETLCGAQAKGAVAKLALKLFLIKPANPKLLVKGGINVEVRGTPRPRAYQWSFDGSGTFANANVRRTRFTAGDAFTPVVSRGRQLVHCEVTLGGGAKLDLVSPLNVTAPRSIASSVTGALPAQTSDEVSTQAIRNPQRSRGIPFYLLEYDVTYTILDQFGDKIIESTRGGANVQARENVPLRSAIGVGLQSLQGFFDFFIPRNTSAAYRNQNDGEIADELRLAPPTSTILTAPNNVLRFLPRTRGANLCTMAGHDWFVTVNGDRALERRVTNNSLATTVADFQIQSNGESVQFSTVYTVRINP